MFILHRLSLAALLLAAAAAGFFATRVREQDRLLDAFIARSLAGVDRADSDAVVLALAREVHAHTDRGVRAADLTTYDRLESVSPFNMTTAVALRYGAFGVVGHPPFGPCGTMTRVLLNACWRLGIPARKLHLIPPPRDTVDIHTIMEWRTGGRWKVIAPSENFVWHARDGRIATLEEIRADPNGLRRGVRDDPVVRHRLRRPASRALGEVPGPSTKADPRRAGRTPVSRDGDAAPVRRSAPAHDAHGGRRLRALRPRRSGDAAAPSPGAEPRSVARRSARASARGASPGGTEASRPPPAHERTAPPRGARGEIVDRL